MEIEDNNIKKQNDNGNAALQKSPAEPKITEPAKTAGIAIHNEITYRGVDLVLNSALAVAFAYFVDRTPMGRKFFTEPVRNFFKILSKPFTRDARTLEKAASGGAAFTSIVVGGSTIIPIMMGLENKEVKKSIVKGIDEVIYGKESVENNPKFNEAYEAIDREPKKGFWAGMAARFTVLTPMLIATMTPAIRETLEKVLYTPISKASSAAASGIGIKPKKMLNVGSDGKTNWEFLHNTIGFDLGLTAIYSFLHEYTYKKFAGIGQDIVTEHAKHEAMEVADKAPIAETHHATHAHRAHVKKHDSHAEHIAASRNTDSNLHMAL